MSSSRALDALDGDDDHTSDNDDQTDQQKRYEFLDAVSVASPGPTNERSERVLTEM